MRNLNSPYARWAKGQLSDSQWYIVAPSGTSMYAELGGIYPPDTEDGLPRVYTTVAAVFAQGNAIVSGRGDKIYLSPDYVTALTAADLLAAEVNGVTIVSLQAQDARGEYTVTRATAALPATATGSIFTVTGRVKLIEIIGTVTTVIQTQACNLKITSTPTATNLTAVDICSNLNVSAHLVNSFYTITGTLANALINNTTGAIAQAGAVTLPAGTLDLITSATNTGSVKWFVRFIPLEYGARMIAF